MSTTSAIVWQAPGPGTWNLDATHVTVPIGRFQEATFLPAYTRGFSRGMAAIGSPLETLEAALVNGWFYIRPKPLGAPDDPKGGPPPRIVLQALFRLHPALRQRLRTAKTVFEDRGWEAVLDTWRTVERPELQARLDAFARVELGDLSDAELDDHVQAVAAAITDSVTLHFAHAPWGSLVTGDYLARSEDAGIDGLAAMTAVAGSSDQVRRPTDLADEVVAALRAEDALGALEVPGPQLFEAVLASGPRSASALGAYLDELGAASAGGGTLSDPTIGEQPAWVQTVLVSRLGPAERDVGADAAARAEALAERIPAPDRDAWRRALAAARTIAPLRDEDAALLSVSLGRARLALLEVGARLVESGIAVALEDAFELRPEEVGPTLDGRGVTAEELRASVEERARQALLDPPMTLGPPADPPPIERFPAPIARVMRAVWAFISRFDAEGDERASGGHGANAGVVTGRAAVIRELADLDRVEPGDIIVARTTMTTFNTVLAMSSGVVTELGGAICHAAIMARELGIPGVVGYADALSIPDRAMIRIDGGAGTVTVLSDAQQS